MIGLHEGNVTEWHKNPLDVYGKPLVYIAGSLRNPAIVEVHKAIEAKGNWEVFSDWKAAHPDGDDAWRDYEQALGYTYIEALQRPAARNIFEFDKRWIDRSQAMVLVLPAGKSGHLELGYAIGKGKKGYILLEEEDPERFDVMYSFANVRGSLEDLLEDF